MPILEVRQLSMRFGGLTAVDNLSFAVEEGSIHGLIGPNGAGKTTTMHAVSALLPVSSGEIWFDDRRIDTLPPEKVVAAGIAQVPEGRRVFPDLTVLENLRTGAFLRRDKAAVEEDLEMVFSHFPRLKERRGQWAKLLSGGEQQMLAIGRALMAKPRLLLLDEPSMGLSPVMVQEIARIILAIAKRGVPVVLVEQNAELALRLADYAYVLETGTVALEGPADTLHDNPHVQSAYLGG